MNRSTLSLFLLSLGLLSVGPVQAQKEEANTQKEPASNLVLYANKGKLEDVKRLIQAGTDVNSVTAAGITALMWAIQGDNAATGNHEEVIAYLLDQPTIDVNVVSKNGRTALTLAIARTIKQNDSTILDALLKHPKINVNLKNKDGLTALKYAKQLNADEQIIQKLIDHGAQKDEKAQQDGE